jgi:hypothetical protein
VLPVAATAAPLAPAMAAPYVIPSYPHYGNHTDDL